MLQLAADDTIVRVARESVRLRPSLRAAMRLERRYGGFGPLAQKLGEQSVAVIADVIRECAVHDTTIPDLLRSMDGFPVGGLSALTDPLCNVVLQLAGWTPGADPEDAPAPATETESWQDYFTKLFRIGTGWLGWTPETTWQATPAEITEAYRGRIEALSALFGGTGDDDTDDPERLPSEEERKAAIAKLRMVR